MGGAQQHRLTHPLQALAADQEAAKSACTGHSRYLFFTRYVFIVVLRPGRKNKGTMGNRE